MKAPSSLKPSFQLVTKQGTWDFFCPTNELTKKWVDTLDSTIEHYNLNELLNEGITNNTVGSGFSIVRATYGILGNEKKIK